MVGNALQRSPGNVGQGAAPCQTGDGAAGLGLPVRCAKAGKGRHHHHATSVGNAVGQRLDLAAARYRVQPIAQPLHHSAADEDAALKGKLGLRPNLRSAGGDQAIAR